MSGRIRVEINMMDVPCGRSARNAFFVRALKETGVPVYSDGYTDPQLGTLEMHDSEFSKSRIFIWTPSTKEETR